MAIGIAFERWKNSNTAGGAGSWSTGTQQAVSICATNAGLSTHTSSSVTVKPAAQVAAEMVLGVLDQILVAERAGKAGEDRNPLPHQPSLRLARRTN
jgi:hypothetical protein